MIRVDFTIGRVIRLLREQEGWTLESLGMSRASASKIELGQRNPRPVTLEKIAERLKVTVQEIHDLVDRLNSVTNGEKNDLLTMRDVDTSLDVKKLYDGLTEETKFFATNMLKGCRALDESFRPKKNQNKERK